MSKNVEAVELPNSPDESPLCLGERTERRLTVFVFAMIAYLFISTALLPPVDTRGSRQPLNQNGQPIAYADSLGTVFIGETGRRQYVVGQGDTLSSIARAWGTTVEDIAMSNPQISNHNIIYVGQVINLP